MTVMSSVAEAMFRVSGNTGNLPENWSWGRLEDLCKGVYDCPHSTPRLTATGPYVARTQDILSGIFLTSSAGRVSEETYRERVARAVPRRGDLLYSREGTYFGIAAEVPAGMKVCLGQRMVLIRPDETMLKCRFLRYWLNSPIMATYIHGFRDGSVAERLNLPTIRSLPVLIPSVSEQSAIAEVLGAFDDKIAVNDRIAETARALARARFRSGQDDGRVDDVELGSVVELLNRGVSPRYTMDQSQLRVLNQKCVRGGRVSLGPSRRTLADKVPARKLLKPHDVLVNSTGIGTLGRVACWNNREASTVDSHVSIVRFDPAKIDPVCAGFAMLDAEPEIEALGEGSTGQTELSRAQLSTLRIRVLPKQRSAALRPVLEALESRGDSALKESLSLAELRDALLPKLMSGQIRVRDAEKVVEEVT